MNVSQRLDLRQTQSLVMTPQLQQAIKLLQMSNQELCSFVASEIETNPLLERGDDQEGLSSANDVPEGVDFSAKPSTETSQGQEAEAPAETPEEQPYESYDSHDAGGTYDPSMPSRSLAETVAQLPSLREHLLSQIHVDFIEPVECLIAAALVEMLDEAGYLPADLELARTQLGASPEIFENVILRLQRLDPPGIFARSLKECLSIQLRDRNRLDPAMAALLDHLDLLAKREKAQLMKLCGVDAEDLADMIAEIRTLTPKPAVSFASDVAPPITPDVILTPLPGGNWHVELNSDNLPRVLVNETFYAKIQDGTRSQDDKTYLSERWQQANWLVKALRQRATTILKVASEIVKQQDKFFVYGVQHLKPLILRDIAEAVEMHESTVSRVTQNKYITTPRGLFELKYFFTNALPSTGGAEGVSTLAVRDRIKALVEAERPEAVLSDDQLAALLRGEGIDIARRTVAKYRESLNIPSSAQRRRDKRS